MAESIQDILKKADTQMRTAERQMFNGKKDEAVALYIEAFDYFKQAKEQDPANTQLKILEPKLNKLKGDLEKRTGKPIGGDTPPAAEMSTAPKVEPVKEAPKPAQQNLPYNARKPLQDALNQFRSMENNLKQLHNPDDSMTASLISRISNSLTSCQQYLDDAKKEVTKAGMESHPEIEKLAADLADIGVRFADAKRKADDKNAAGAAKAEEVIADCDGLKTEYERLRSALDKCGMLYFNELEPLKEHIIAIEEFEKNQLPDITQKLSNFESKYGKSRDEINKNANDAGYTGVTSAADGWSMLTDRIKAIPETRNKMAEEIINRMEGQLSNLKNTSDFHRLQQHNALREWLKMAERYNGENQKVVQMKNSLEAKLKTDIEEFNAQIDKRSWPGNSTDINSDAALKYFNQNSDWFKPPHAGKVLGVAIHGDWTVQERDILGNPVMYGIPVFVAVVMDEEKETGLARVYDLTLRNMEKQGAVPEPPFTSDTVGSSYYIRAEKIH